MAQIKVAPKAPVQASKPAAKAPVQQAKPAQKPVGKK